MKTKAFAILAFWLISGIGLAHPTPPPAARGGGQFVGYISDSMCGLKHMMQGESDAKCTLDCVKKMGAKFVLADRANGKVYELSDQKTPEKFAGKKVRVTGSLKGKLIVVSSIEAAP